MTTFANEPHHVRRSFSVGWPARLEAALAVAQRVQSMAERLAEIEPWLGELWPQFTARSFRAGDVGPVLDMSPQDLGGVIDRLGRRDPPRLPAPVGRMGYAFGLLGPRENPWKLWIRVGSGRARDPLGSAVTFDLANEHPIWRSVDQALQLQHALIDAWDAAWACATAAVLPPPPYAEGENLNKPSRPWMTWTATPTDAIPFPLRDLGEPAEVRRDHGGELRIWP